jgi:hypothetical protein
MKAMPDPKIVAAKIQGSAARAHGAALALALMTPSSHGWTKIAAMAKSIFESQSENRLALASLANFTFSRSVAPSL